MLRLAITYSMIITVAAGLYLLSGPPQKGQRLCGSTVHLARLLTLNINCDSMGFIDPAIDPGQLLRKGTGRQERPLFVASAALLTHLLIAIELWRLVPERVYKAFAASLAFKTHYDKHHVSLNPRLYSQYVVCAYVSYLLMNGALLLCALLLFHWLVVGWSPNVIVMGFASLLLANDVVKAFLWSAHTMMFTFVVPFGCVLVCQELLKSSCRSAWWTGRIGLLTGILSLAYGSFPVWILAGVAALALGHRGMRTRLNVRGFILHTSALIFGFALPVLAWITTCKVLAGGYYNPEIEKYDQFIWVLHSARLGSHQLVSALFWYGINFCEVLLSVAGFPLLLLGVVVLVGFESGAPLRLIITERKPVFTAIGLTTASCILFFYLLGFYQGRLELDVVLPLLLAAAILTTGIVDKARGGLSLRLAVFLVWAVSVVCLAYEAAKPFPVI